MVNSNNKQAELDKWYAEYCKQNKKAPTWSELIAKAKELGIE